MIMKVNDNNNYYNNTNSNINNDIILKQYHIRPPTVTS